MFSPTLAEINAYIHILIWGKGVKRQIVKNHMLILRRRSKIFHFCKKRRAYEHFFLSGCYFDIPGIVYIQLAYSCFTAWHPPPIFHITTAVLLLLYASKIS